MAVQASDLQSIPASVESRAGARARDSVDRRRLLLGLAAASTAAAAPAAVASARPAEKPELVQLAQELPAIEARYLAAQAHEAATRAKWAPLWPLAPDDITEPGAAGWALSGSYERSFVGAAMTRRCEKHPRRVRTASEYRWLAEDCRDQMKRKKMPAGITRAECEAERSDALRRMEVAERYEAETRRITAAANYTAAWQAHAAAADALADHIGAMMAQSETTTEGLVLKARALGVWGRVDGLYQSGGAAQTAEWCLDMAEAVIRLNPAAV